VVYFSFISLQTNLQKPSNHLNCLDWSLCSCKNVENGVLLGIFLLIQVQQV